MTNIKLKLMTNRLPIAYMFIELIVVNALFYQTRTVLGRKHLRWEEHFLGLCPTIIVAQFSNSTETIGGSMRVN